jgi:hypothetical protein
MVQKSGSSVQRLVLSGLMSRVFTPDFDVYSHLFLVYVRLRAYMRSIGFDINSPNASMSTQSFTQKMWETIVQEKASTNESFRCAAWGTRPAVCKSAQTLSEVIGEPSGSWYYKVRLIPCFPVCDKGKCHLLAQKVGGRITDVAVAKGATRTAGAAINALTGGLTNHTINFPATNTHFTCDFCCSVKATFICSRCLQANYCSAACRKKGWGQHKKACKLIKCNNCDRIEISNEKLFSSCSRCFNAFYCGKECQREHWKAHKAACKATSNSSPKK